MFDRLMILYQNNKIGNTEIENAIKKGWITKEQAAEITGIGSEPTTFSASLDVVEQYEEQGLSGQGNALEKEQDGNII